jgi:hypothetical protein
VCAAEQSRRRSTVEETQQRCYPTKDGESLQPYCSEHPLQYFGAQFGDFSFEPRGQFAEPMVQLGETKVEIFSSYNSLTDGLGKRAGDFLRLPTGQPGSLEALSQS